VATMLLCDDKADRIETALRTLRTWNPDWHPKFVMSDFSLAQISATEAVFPDCRVILCKFHHIQARRKHLVNNRNNTAWLSMLERIANARTPSAYEKAISDMHNSESWNEDTSFREYTENTWISEK